ncbi:2-C-methyl-D-erythritol 2,4-cyclodiphosphate synthase [Candidatus Beckwithbacteria bacterium RBG_13_42_9]|uniref:2-C-methyl-D-erythritol 2,4-cyclodiphosphate synthase n=1 Tax=Candidatus Beckwithbacteria bacterium RBG_13_42_9 TaxID=1797457 RepID=A0A1F5E4F2_9BACT|nr:MAG: 2-C-methyl-D-erythritol 2,4-cyclodiphosphate synthase [Candidatus Beckwithbacteria bacterium RBG_13_42_9]
MTNQFAFRIGLGQDSHIFSSLPKPLFLGGVKIGSSGGLEANSDGDVILHALANAVSSAIGGDSLGTWADDLCQKGIKESKIYVLEVVKKMVQLHWHIVNISISVEALKPRLSLAEIAQIKKSLAELLNLEINQIGITFTSGEGSFGKGEGIQVLAAVLLGGENDQN